VNFGRKYIFLLYGFPILILFITQIITISCKKNNDICLPVAFFDIIPKNGNTVTEFNFDASETVFDCKSKDILYRWDFEGDGIWDNDFSKNNQIIHRYYNKGQYTPILEVKHLSGNSDTISMNVNVIQGNSPPWPALSVDKYYGNIKTVFEFDGSKTRDDEDSLNTLKFRWDWENDGEWDTEYSINPINTHIFTDTGLYITNMEAVDTAGLTAQISKKLLVDLINPNLLVDINITPDSGTSRDTFSFDASQCVDLEGITKDFLYSWRLWDANDSVVIKTNKTEQSVIKHKFEFHQFGAKRIQLTIHDQQGLLNILTKDFEVHYDNKPPVADFFAVPKRGNINTEFYFNSEKLCTDPDEAWWKLYYRWDFDNDGTWDTNYSRYNREVNFQYTSPGEYKAILEVMDSGGLTDTTEFPLIVSSGTNETDIIVLEYGNPEDFQYEYYGTVKIGDQWWMSENLNFDDDIFLTAPRVNNNLGCYRRCYDYDPNFAEGWGNIEANRLIYGGMYRILDLIVIRIGNDYSYLANCQKDSHGNPIICPPIEQRVCPEGWHVSSTKDWEKLIEYLGPNAANELKPGGSTDFNVLYGGEGNFSPMLNRSSYLGLGEYASFAAFNLDWVRTGVTAMTDVFKIHKNSSEIETGTYSTFSRYSVRCVKND